LVEEHPAVAEEAIVAEEAADEEVAVSKEERESSLYVFHPILHS
jgi:hypothetical protein